MKQPLLIAACLVLFVALINVSMVGSSPVREGKTEMGRLLTHINDILTKLRDKRGCQGYMCSHAHMSSHAGDLAVASTLRKYYMECATNPNCIPNHRWKRHSPFASLKIRSRSANSGKSQGS